MADTPPKGKRDGKSGPKRNLDLMELAVQLRLRGFSWRQTSRGAGVALGTLMEWKDTDEWAAIRERLANGRAEKMTHISFEVLARIVSIELTRKRPDPSLAKWWLEHTFLARPGAGDEEYPAAGAGVRRYIVELPMMEKGLHGKPATQVLMAPPVAAPSPEPPKQKGRKQPPPPKGKRRIVGPDE